MRRARALAIALLSRRAIGVLCLFAALVTCRDDGPRSREPTAPLDPTPALDEVPTVSVTLVGAGDIATCSSNNDAATALLLDAIVGTDGARGTVFTVGDNAYSSGTATEYSKCYQPTWGRHKANTRPIPGDRDYSTSGASGYFGYFGAAAGEVGKGYYSYDIGEWHVVMLNSAISTTATAPQTAWLKADLAANAGACVIAVWHQAMFSSSSSSVRTAVKPLWEVLYQAGADVIVSAQYRNYERFAPQTPAGAADAAYGIRQFVVGTGGSGSQSFGTIRANSEARNAGTYGVLKLTLGSGNYEWEFVPVAGKTYTDRGTGTCHGAPPAVINAGQDRYASQNLGFWFDATFSAFASSGVGWPYTIDWGDGATTNGTATSAGVIPASWHSYTESGTFTVRVTISEPSGAQSTDEAVVRVLPAAPVLVGAGDVASCNHSGRLAVGAMLDTIPGVVFAAGDLAYPDGTATQFATCYDPSWGRHKLRTMPAPGNHEYHTTGASGYYQYWGPAAGESNKGYYSFDHAGWHVVVLNSELPISASSAQIAWLKADLASSSTHCTVAYWHKPRFSSGSHGNNTAYQPAWEALYAAGADVVLTGHDHDYERFAPQTPTGVADLAYGIRSFVVGTGGYQLRSFSTIRANSELRYNSSFGLLRLDLEPTAYKWQFVTPAGVVVDAGSGECHDRPPA
jgi:hypothetical protein